MPPLHLGSAKASRQGDGGRVCSAFVLTEPTNDREEIYHAIRKTSFGNGTSLYDAVHLTIAKRLNGVEGRKAVVLFTDGVDTTSRKQLMTRRRRG